MMSRETHAKYVNVPISLIVWGFFWGGGCGGVTSLFLSQDSHPAAKAC